MLSYFRTVSIHRIIQILPTQLRNFAIFLVKMYIPIANTFIKFGKYFPKIIIVQNCYRQTVFRFPTNQLFPTRSIVKIFIKTYLREKPESFCLFSIIIDFERVERNHSSLGRDKSRVWGLYCLAGCKTMP